MRQICFYIPLFCMITTAMRAENTFSERPLKLDAEVVDYNGQEIYLCGKVTVEHDLGTVCAGEVNLETSKDQKKNRLAMLHMKDNVSVTFQDGGTLTCAEAKINPNTLRGEFTSYSDAEKVTFNDRFGKKEENPIPLEVKGRNMKVAFDRKEDLEELNKVMLKKIIVTDDVTVEYNHDLFIKADQGIYDRSTEPEDQLSSFTLPGVITLRSLNGPCHVTTAQKDEMVTDEIYIDTVKRELTLYCPKGAMQLDTKRIHFQADELIWDEKNDVLTMIGNVEVNQEGYGKLKTDQQVHIKRILKDGKKMVASIESQGMTIMTYLHSDKNGEYTLTCPGNVFVDHQRSQTTMQGLADEQGNISDEGQIHFQDTVGEIYADLATIEYSVEPSIAPQKIVLTGNVRIYNHANAEQAQYALADYVEFIPVTKEMIFAANGKNRVLFFDKINQLQVSAPKLLLKREEGSKKESIKGYGDVRFNFVEKEFEQLRKRFRFNDGI